MRVLRGLALLKMALLDRKWKKHKNICESFCNYFFKCSNFMVRF